MTRRSAGTRRTGFPTPTTTSAAIRSRSFSRDLLSDFGRFEIKPIKFAAYEDMVAVLGTYEGVGKVTGFEFEDRFIHLWKVNDGRAEWMGLYRESGPAFRDLDRLTGVARSGDFAQPPTPTSIASSTTPRSASHQSLPPSHTVSDSLSLG